MERVALNALVRDGDAAPSPRFSLARLLQYPFAQDKKMIVRFLSRATSLTVVGVGFAITIGALVSCIQEVRFENRAKETSGEIVRYSKRNSKGGAKIDFVYAYCDGSGHRWEGGSIASADSFSADQKLLIYYDPQAPMNSQTGNNGSLDLLLLVVLGAAFTAASLVSMIKEERKAKISSSGSTEVS